MLFLLLMRLPINGAEGTLALLPHFLAHECCAVRRLPVEKVNSESGLWLDGSEGKNYQSALDVQVGAVCHALVLEHVQLLPYAHALLLLLHMLEVLLQLQTSQTF